MVRFEIRLRIDCSGAEMADLWSPSRGNSTGDGDMSECRVGSAWMFLRDETNTTAAPQRRGGRHEARSVPAELPRQGDRQGARRPHRASPRSSTSTRSGRSTGSSSRRPPTARSSQYSFGMMKEFPKAVAGVVPRRVVPGLAADPVARREDLEGADRHEHHRHAVPRARRARRGDRHRRPPVERPAQRRCRRRLDARGVRGRQRLAHLPEAAQARARDDRDHAGHLDERPVRVPRRVRRLRAAAGSAPSRCRTRTRRSSSAVSRTRSVRPTGSPSTTCRAGSGSRTRRTSSPSGERRSSASSTSSRSRIDGRSRDVQHVSGSSSPTSRPIRPPPGKASNLLVGTADQITDNLKRFKEAGLTMPLLWPPFADVPVSKTLDDLRSSRTRSCRRSTRRDTVAFGDLPTTARCRLNPSRGSVGAGGPAGDADDAQDQHAGEGLVAILGKQVRPTASPGLRLGPTQRRPSSAIRPGPTRARDQSSRSHRSISNVALGSVSRLRRRWSVNVDFGFTRSIGTPTKPSSTA